MGLNNGTKTQTFVKKVTLDDNTIITMVGQLNQTNVKESLRLQYVKETPGGKILDVIDDRTLCTFDNEPGIRKEFYMGWSVCDKDDYDVYDVKAGVKYAKNKFSRPLVTRNFTYLNADQVYTLLDNEITFVVNKFFFGRTVKCVDNIFDVK